MSIDEAITRYKSNAEYERTHGDLQGCLEFRQLAEWLGKYQKIEQILKDIPYGGDATLRRIQEVMMMGMSIEEINKEICSAKMVISVINNVTTPMLMYDEEKTVTKKALLKYIAELESELRGR